MERYLFYYDIGLGDQVAAVEGLDFWECIKTFATQHPGGHLKRVREITTDFDVGVYTDPPALEGC